MSESMMDRRQLVRGAGLVTGGIVVAGATGIALASPFGVAAAASRPRIHKAAEWHASPPTHRPMILDRRPNRLVVHHTASANSRDGSLRHAFALARRIQHSHLARGWADSGQQFTVSRGGHIMVGRRQALAAVESGRHLVGAHVADHNSHALGIENEGTYMRVRPPGALLHSLVATLAWLCDAYELNPHRAIVGHRDLNATACPGTMLYRLLPDIRNAVARRLGRPTEKRATTLDTEPPPGTPSPRGPLDHGPAIGPGEAVR